MQKPGRENPSMTAVWGRLHSQPDASNIQQRLGDNLKPHTLETARRESYGHCHKSSGALCVCVCVFLNAGTYPQQIIAPHIKY